MHRLFSRYLNHCLTIVLVVSFCFVIPGCGSNIKSHSIPLKMGLLVPYTGVFANLGNDITRGMELYLDEVGWKAGGREIKLIKEDDESNGQTGLQKTRKLVENDKIDILAGVVSSTVAYAIRDYIVGSQIPFIISNAGAADLTREKGSKYIFRVSFSNGQFEYPMGAYAYNQLKYRRVVVMAPDYAAGHEKATGFITGFKKAGGQIVQEIYPKLGTTDFGPFLTQVKEADAVWAFFSGSDSISFVKQYEEYGLKKKLPLICAGDLVDESALPSQGDAAVGILSSAHYSAALETPENEKFAAAYKSKYKVDPNMFAEQGYVTAKVIIDALGTVNGNVADKDKLLAAIRSANFDAPRGPFKFEAKSQNVIFNVYIRKVEKKDGKLVNTVLETIPEIKDDWNR